MYKVCVILKNGVEINTVSEQVTVRKDCRGKVRYIAVDRSEEFMRYLDCREIVAVLTYPVQAEEGQSNG